MNQPLGDGQSVPNTARSRVRVSDVFENATELFRRAMGPIIKAWSVTMVVDLVLLGVFGLVFTAGIGELIFFGLLSESFFAEGSDRGLGKAGTALGAGAIFGSVMVLGAAILVMQSLRTALYAPLRRTLAEDSSLTLSAGEILRRALDRVPVIIGVHFAMVFATFAFIGVAAALSLLVSIWVGVFLGFFFVIAALFYTPYLVAVPYVAATRPVGVIESFRQTFQLTQGRWGIIVKIVFLLTLAIVVASALVAVPVSVTGMDGGITGIVTESVSYFATMYVGWIGMGALYMSLDRAHQEHANSKAPQPQNMQEL